METAPSNRKQRTRTPKLYVICLPTDHTISKSLHNSSLPDILVYCLSPLRL